MIYGRDYTVWQPAIDIEYCHGLEITVVYISKDVSFGVPTLLLDEMKAWYHEFIELAVLDFLFNFVDDPQKTISFIHNYHIPHGIEALHNTSVNVLHFNVPHIVASLTSWSGINGKWVTIDEFWSVLHEAPSQEEVARKVMDSVVKDPNIDVVG